MVTNPKGLFYFKINFNQIKIYIMTALKNKIKRIQSIVSSIENAQSSLLETQFLTVNEDAVADSELLILQINAEENEFLFI
ncbi:hypothetical protein FLJC2902T_00500 [Flavobacterium limnosediminis JC2902]|uniref:Uncharacterized protein n=2 Tax=Flavobacterium TaxID=237 RepID=V6STS8_9FLAO|nr:hypothetical protein FLJC2902T_00500 [Flavobacterium limnosediminis JC2902]